MTSGRSIDRAGPRRVAALAKLFAELAVSFFELAPQLPALGPPLGAAPAPRGRAHAEVRLERARERGRGREAVVQRDLEDAPIGRGQERSRGALEAKTLDESKERLARDGAKHAVKVKRRERGDAGERIERQRVAEMLGDVIDDAVDASLVFLPGPVHTDFWCSP